MKLISVHMPKTAGGSFRQLLLSHFKKRMYDDVQDFPLNHSDSDRTTHATEFRNQLKTDKTLAEKYAQIDCIHGHFLPYKYLDYHIEQKVHFITWLRDPLERLASHYFFWKNLETNDESPFLLRRMQIENWSFEKFCFSEEMKNVYEKFLWKFPIDNFTFIGVSEYFKEDLQYFSRKFLHKELKEISERNVNVSKPESYFNDQGMVRELKQFHQEDYELYSNVLQSRNHRLSL